MKLSTKLLSLTAVIMILIAIVVKVYFEGYFTPRVNNYIEESIKQSLEKDMEGFERIIITVVTAAQGNYGFVREALVTISKDKKIPIDLRRSELINSQFGNVPERSAKNIFEKKVFATGKAIFRKTEQNYEYIYPLKAQRLCQQCHVTKSGEAVAEGYVLGLAIKRIPRAALQKKSLEKASQPLTKSLSQELSLAYFVMDLFWPTLILLGLSIGILLIFIFRWVIRPLKRINEKVIDSYIHDESIDEDYQKKEGELDGLEKRIYTLLHNKNDEK